MPFTHVPSRDECVETMHKSLRANLMEVDNTVDNRGAAGAYNIGAHHVVDNNLDWLITLSPSTRFGPEGGRDFIKFLDKVNDTGWVVEAEVPVGWHFIAWHRRLFDAIGFWDENFWPVYGEDADISKRILIAIEEMKLTNVWHRFEMDGWLTMQGYSAHLGKKQHSQVEIWEYYKRKWGGLSGQEEYNRPFGDKPLDYWEKL